MARTITVVRGADPFKKYWWLILLLFTGIAGWICIPLMGSSTGSGTVAVPQEGGLKGAQSLDGIAGSGDAPGGALDMPAPGAAAKAAAESASSLYQAPGDGKPAPASVEGVSAPGHSLADALKFVAHKGGAASASADPRGWGEAPRKAFTAPKANFGALSGFSGSSASGASSFSGGAAVGLTGFGANKPNTGLAQTKGLQPGAVPDSVKGKAMDSLQHARDAAAQAAQQGNADAARAMGGASFDGGRGMGSSVGGNMAGISATGVYGALDAAPINLKPNDASLQSWKVEPKAPPVPMPKTDPNAEMKQMMMMMVMQVAMGGLMMALGGA